MRGSVRLDVVRVEQFVLKIEKMSHIIGAGRSQDLRSLSPIIWLLAEYVTTLVQCGEIFCVIKNWIIG